MLTLNLIKKKVDQQMTWHHQATWILYFIWKWMSQSNWIQIQSSRSKVQDQISIYLGILEHFVHPYVDKLSSFRSTWDLSTTPKLLVTCVLTVVLLGLPDQLTGLTSTPQRICVVLSRRMRHQTNHKYSLKVSIKANLGFNYTSVVYSSSCHMPLMKTFC